MNRYSKFKGKKGLQAYVNFRINLLDIAFCLCNITLIIRYLNNNDNYNRNIYTG